MQCNLYGTHVPGQKVDTKGSVAKRMVLVHVANNAYHISTLSNVPINVLTMTCSFQRDHSLRSMVLSDDNTRTIICNKMPLVDVFLQVIVVHSMNTQCINIISHNIILI